MNRKINKYTGKFKVALHPSPNTKVLQDHEYELLLLQNHKHLNQH